MPLDAFNHLSSEKKSTLLNAAYEEFSKKDYDRVSVFEIARQAGISRGAFYCYFENKEDLYFYLLADLKNEFFEKYVKGKSPDFFRSARDLLIFLSQYKGMPLQGFIEKILQNMKPSTQAVFTDSLERKNCKMNCEAFENLRINDKADMALLGSMVMSGMTKCLLIYYAGKASLNKVEAMFDRMLEMLKYGVLKE